VLAQTFADFELVIIDDNSPDDTFAIASSYSDPRVRCLRNPANLGPEGNWNRCLAEAKGRYFKLLPQDDLLAPDCLQREVDVLEADAQQQIAIVFCARTIVDARSRPVLVRRPFGGRSRRLTAAAIFRRCLRRGTNVVGEPGGVLFRRALTNAVGRFDATFGYVVDLDYWLRLLAHGDGYYLPETLASFRVSSGAWSVAIGRSQAEQFSGLAIKMAQRPDLAPGPIDLAAGRLVARANNVVRLLMYRFMFRK
jgi:glycosyltransferase involved in cell wall biosynthesis